jgi:hypothetical protein
MFLRYAVQSNGWMPKRQHTAKMPSAHYAVNGGGAISVLRLERRPFNSMLALYLRRWYDSRALSLP